MPPALNMYMNLFEYASVFFEGPERKQKMDRVYKTEEKEWVYFDKRGGYRKEWYITCVKPFWKNIRLEKQFPPAN